MRMKTTFLQYIGLDRFTRFERVFCGIRSAHRPNRRGSSPPCDKKRLAPAHAVGFAGRWRNNAQAHSHDATAQHARHNGNMISPRSPKIQPAPRSSQSPGQAKQVGSSDQDSRQASSGLATFSSPALASNIRAVPRVGRHRPGGVDQAACRVRRELAASIPAIQPATERPIASG